MSRSLIFKRLLRDNRGATAIEYGLIVSLIIIAMIVAMQSLAGATTGLWEYLTDQVVTAQ